MAKTTSIHFLHHLLHCEDASIDPTFGQENPLNARFKTAELRALIDQLADVRGVGTRYYPQTQTIVDFLIQEGYMERVKTGVYRWTERFVAKRDRVLRLREEQEDIAERIKAPIAEPEPEPDYPVTFTMKNWINYVVMGIDPGERLSRKRKKALKKEHAKRSAARDMPPSRFVFHRNTNPPTMTEVFPRETRVVLTRMGRVREA